MEVEGLVRGVLAGDRRAVARAISLVEDGRPELERLSAGIYGATGRAVTVGITGAPGVGKSTLAGALVGMLRADERRVAVLAVDPTSPYTGGALLGDRVRMQEHATDPDVFIRSMATRGHLGGMALAAPEGVRILDAAGYGKPTSSWIGVGVGIASGEEFVGNVGGGGFKDFTAIGDVTNTAARLTSAARGGEIVLDAATHATVVDDYPAAVRELLPLKGKEVAVEAFRLRLG